jgi:leucyl-tRNA synthetase
MPTDVALGPEEQTEPDSHYSPATIESHWQRVWRTERAFATPAQDDEREPAYVFADGAAAGDDAWLGQIRTYTIADAGARFLRARGRAVLFSLGFDSFGPAAERASLRAGLPAGEWAQRRREQLSKRFESLGFSFDLERAFMSCEAEHYRWTQALFLKLLQRDVIYRRGNEWVMRVEPHVAEIERGLDALAGWDPTAIERQRQTIGRVDGIELRASTFDRGDLTVFTPHVDAVAQAAFVAISPSHPDIEDWTTEPAIAEQVSDLRAAQRRAEEDAETIRFVATDTLATVPGVDGMLPVVISPLVDGRFGPTAVLGMPELDPVDRAIAERLPTPSGTAWKTSGSKASTRAAVRYAVQDLTVSQARAWGAPIPLVDCPACGTVSVAVEELPVRLPDDLRLTGEAVNPLADRADFCLCACPACGASAVRETSTIDCRLDGMWMWMALCVPAQRRASAMFDDVEYARWLPAHQVVSDVDAAAGVFERRLLAEALQDLGELPPLPDREPFSRALMHGGVRPPQTAIGEHLGDLLDPDELLARVGADALRLAMLHAASPGRGLGWSDQPLRRSQAFLQRLHGFAEPRLREWARLPDRPAQPSIDASDRLRRRLAHWCTVACEKVTTQLECLQLQRAAHNDVLLLTRIEDFEARVLEQREQIQAPDREAIVAALLLLVQLVAPLAPHIAEELWSAAGNATLVGAAGWPTPSRPAQVSPA